MNPLAKVYIIIISNIKKKIIAISKNSFEYKSIIGRGGFGKVWKVYNRKNKKYYAMKEMSKAKIIDKRSEKSVKNERDLLSKINHPFIVNMHYSFQDTNTLYLVMDLLTGGDLRYHICKQRKFTESQSKFFIACILLGLEYCHRNKIIHRDIKPENLVLDSNGYVHITDFGIAKIQKSHNSKETSGTPGYMSPEVMCGQDHTILVDYFAIGVMGYEFMKGYRPYLGKSRKEIKEKMISHQAHVKKNELYDWSEESCDFVNRLLMRKPCLRLGYRDFLEVKGHKWFFNFNWKDLYLKKIVSPFIPMKGDNFDYKYCNAIEKQGINTMERYSEIVMKEDYVWVFKDYFYFNRYTDYIDNCFENIHEILYNDKRNNHSHHHFNNYKREFEENKNSNSNEYFKDNVDKIVYNIKKLNKKKNKKNELNNKLYENFKSQKIPKKKNYIHIRANSALSIGTNQAFFEANNYINDRKMKRNQSLLNNKMLIKESSYIVPLNDTNKNNESNGTNNTKENNFSKTMRISKSSKFMKFVNN